MLFFVTESEKLYGISADKLIIIFFAYSFIFSEFVKEIVKNILMSVERMADVTAVKYAI